MGASSSQAAGLKRSLYHFCGLLNHSPASHTAVCQVLARGGDTTVLDHSPPSHATVTHPTTHLRRILMLLYYSPLSTTASFSASSSCADPRRRASPASTTLVMSTVSAATAACCARGWQRVCGSGFRSLRSRIRHTQTSQTSLSHTHTQPSKPASQPATHTHTHLREVLAEPAHLAHRQRRGQRAQVDDGSLQLRAPHKLLALLC